MFFFSFLSSTTSSNNFGSAVFVKTSPQNRGSTVWESNSPAPVSQSSAHGPSSKPGPFQNQAQAYTLAQAQPQSGIQLNAPGPAEASARLPPGSSELTLKITTPFKRMI